MATQNTAAGSGSVSFCGLLAILFIGLKLGGVIDWSWLWVLAPLWIPITCGLLIWAMILIILILTGFFK